MGIFAKKQQSSELELPEVPPVEDLDLPPPPQYPQPHPAERLAVPEPPFQQTQLDKIEVPLEHIVVSHEPANIVTKELEGGLTRERILKAIGVPTTAPIFVRVDDYREIIDGTGRIRNNLKEATDIVLRMGELKNEQDKEFERWRLQLEDVQRKLMYVDKVIFESSGAQHGR